MQEKTKLLFVITSFNVGGVEKSLLSLLKHLPEKYFSIDVGVIRKEGEFLEMLPPNINVFEIPSLTNLVKYTKNRKAYIKQCLRAFNIIDALTAAFFCVRSKLKDSTIPYIKHYLDVINDNLPEYDIAISYQGPDEVKDYYVSDYVKSKKKFGWIHFDVDKFFISKGTTEYCYSKFDKIFVVSKEAKETFDCKFPTLAKKTELFLNIIDGEEIRDLATKYNPFPSDITHYNIVTVGRLDTIKGQDIAIRAAAELKKQGCKFRWYMVGEGPMMSEYKQLASSLNLDNEIIFVGRASNPYPYMANCDLYVQPSRSEGYCLAIGEAKIFGVPIITTNFIGANEQLKDTPNALVVEDETPTNIANAIREAFNIGRIESDFLGNNPSEDRIREVFMKE